MNTGWCQRCVRVFAGFLLAAVAGFVMARDATVRSVALAPAGDGRPGFTRLDASKTGLTFTNVIPESRHLTNQLLLDGGGVTAGDVDGDGRTDVFFAGLGGGSGLWRNLGGLQFSNVTGTAFGAGSPLATLDATGCVLADLDGDGDADLVVNSHGQGTHVFLNDGRGVFRPLPPLNAGRGGHSVAVADVDGDGWLDLYVVNYRVRALMDMPNARATFRVVNGRTEVATVDGRPVTEPDLANRFIVNARGGVEELGEADVLYLGRGGTQFVEVPWTGGVWVDADGRPLREPPWDWGLAAQFRDLDGDGRPELYVCNDFQSPDRLWLNESTPGRPRFRAAPRGTLRHTSRFSMGVDFADVNRDGHDDFVVLDMLSRDHVTRLTQLEDPAPASAEQADPLATPQYDVNTLQMGRGDGSFVEMAAFAGLQASEWSWTPAFLDVDLDGWEDLLVTTGQWRASRDLDVAAELRRLRQTRRMTDAELFAARRRFSRLDPPMVAFHNQGGRFRECAAEWGLAFKEVSQGLCLADLDDDGDPDVLINHINAPASVLRNDASGPRIRVRPSGLGGLRGGVGARITVRETAEGALVQSQELSAGGRYLSSDAPERTFALVGRGPWTLAVRWPDGRQVAVTNIAAGHAYEIAPDGAVPAASRPPGPPPVATLFEDWSARLGHTNRFESFDEFIRQPLLPRRIATEGVGITWADLDGDGAEELVLGGGYNGAMEVFRCAPDGSFRRMTNAASPRSQPMILPWQGRLLLAESIYTEGAAHGAALRVWPGTGPALAAGANAVGSLAMADVDGDGTPEVFVGARVIPGRWPREPSSALVSPGTNGFVIRQVLTNAGLVTAAVFADLDGDGDADLSVSAEWSEPRFFRNDAGRLVRWDRTFRTGAGSEPVRLSGMWTSVNAGDFDADGRMDLVMGNWGENTYWELFGREWSVVHGDLDGDGTEDLFTAHPAQGGPMAGPAWLVGLRPMHGLEILGSAVPALRERFRLHRDFAGATLDRIIGAETPGMRRVDADWAASVVLMNRDTHWEVIRLPDAAQCSPVFGIAVADWDGDGQEDLFLAQNFFGQNHGLPRDDAGLGLILRGRGDGRFEPVPPARCGIRIEGEGRTAAVSDIDSDGRPDLVVGTLGGPTRVFRNRDGKPGIRVRLDAGPANPTAAGARVRWSGGGRSGPVRAWRAGAGHGAVDSAVQVLARPAQVDGTLEVTWPDGAVERVAVGAAVHGVRLRRGGGMEEMNP